MPVSDPSSPPSAPTVVGPPTTVVAPASAVAASPADPALPYEQCDECGSPVDTAQRYCVMCGAHRRHVDDPAARYLGQASARTRGARSSAGAAARRPAGRGRSLGAALMLAVIPVAAAVGVAVGRSSGNNDAELIRALARHQAAVVTTSAAASSPTGTAAGVRSTGRTPANGAGKRRKASTASTRKAAKANASTQYGTVTQIAGSKPTKVQEQQGAQDTQKVQRSTGKTYVNQQNNLPGTVVVP